MSILQNTAYIGYYKYLLQVCIDTIIRRPFRILHRSRTRNNLHYLNRHRHETYSHQRFWESQIHFLLNTLYFPSPSLFLRDAVISNSVFPSSKPLFFLQPSLHFRIFKFLFRGGYIQNFKHLFSRIRHIIAKFSVCLDVQIRMT
jgi:hypothetical protein